MCYNNGYNGNGIIILCHISKNDIATHILVSDRNIVRGKKVCDDIRYLLDQAHMLVKGICCCMLSDGVIDKYRRFRPELVFGAM